MNRADLLSAAVQRVAPDPDVSRIWDTSHSHLRPLEDHLEFRDGALEACTLCGVRRALRIVCHLRFGPDFWVERGVVLYCFGCGRYSIPRDELTHHIVRAMRAAIRRRAVFSLPSYRRVTAVDARLWSRSPTVLNLEPTTRCNFRCWYCVGRHMEQQDLVFDDFAKVLDNFPSVKLLALVGEGEPLMHRQFFDMVELAGKRGVKVATISNGSLLTEDAIAKICQSGLYYISFSVDSCDPQEFAQSRVGGSLERVWDGIERLAKYRNAHGYHVPHIGLKGTLFPHTKHRLRAIVEEAKRRGVDVVESFQALNPKASYVAIYPPEKRELIASYNEVAETLRRVDTSDVLPSLAQFIESQKLDIQTWGTANGLRANCDEVWFYSLLSGDVTPCCQIKTPIRREWNLCHHSLEQILKDQHYENIRFNLWNGVFPKYCEGCVKTTA